MHPLDNPVWHALSGPQKMFGYALEKAARYRSDVSPFAAVMDESIQAFTELSTLYEPGDIASVISGATSFPAFWDLVGTVELRQFVCEHLATEPDREMHWVDLGASDAESMIALARSTNPGPFEKYTCQLGDYVGLKDDGELISMAGERICFDGFREVSAVCTAQGYGGRGYAQALVAEIARRQFARNTASYLHVRIESPAEAIAAQVYEKLGYSERTRFPLQILRRL